MLCLTIYHCSNWELTNEMCCRRRRRRVHSIIEKIYLSYSSTKLFMHQMLQTAEFLVGQTKVWRLNSIK